eukprot:scaffold38432_cov52-Phaeocystis_antarctica.AAC.3
MPSPYWEGVGAGRRRRGSKDACRPHCACSPVKAPLYSGIQAHILEMCGRCYGVKQRLSVAPYVRRIALFEEVRCRHFSTQPSPGPAWFQCHMRCYDPKSRCPVDLWDYVGTMASIHILARAAPATEESVTQDGG